MSSHRDRAVYRRGRGEAAVQPSLLADPLEERLSSEPMVLALRQLVELLLGDELRRDFTRAGGYAYDPVGLFCVWMYGLMDGVRSSRRLERSCRYDERYQYLCRSCQPDHSTLSRFRQSLGGSLDSMFSRIAQAAREHELPGRVAMVDGTKIPAARSQWKRYLKEAEAEDSEPDGVAMRSYGKSFMGYNVQVAVDMDSAMILGHATTCSRNDLSAMESVMVAIESQSGSLPDHVVTDKGYASHGNAYALDSRGIEALLPPSSSTAPFSPQEDGTFQCAAGKTACERYEYDGNYGLHYRHLWVSGCRSCPLAAGCGNGKGSNRRLKIQVNSKVGDLRRANLNALAPEHADLMQRRKSVIEPVFAIFKWCWGFNRFTLRTQKGAHLEFGLFALAYNIRKLMRAISAFLQLILSQISRLHGLPHALSGD